MGRKKPLTPGEIVVANIKYYQVTTGESDEALYTAARMCRATWYNRLRTPNTFMLSELLGIARKLPALAFDIVAAA